MEKSNTLGKQGRIVKNSLSEEWDYLIGKKGTIMPPLRIYGFDDLTNLVSLQLGQDSDIMNRVNVPIGDIEIIES